VRYRVLAVKCRKAKEKMAKLLKPRWHLTGGDGEYSIEPLLHHAFAFVARF
jgi:hypothetical protein